MKKLIFLACGFLAMQLFAHSSFAAVGETYSQMAQRYGTPSVAPLGRVVGPGKAAAYEARGARSYVFEIDGFKTYAAFNANNVCFMMATFNNRTLPDASLFAGKLANTAPKELMHIPLRARTLQYGSGANAVIYRTFGFPGKLNAEAVSNALKP